MISFHSLEDRVVKQFIRAQAASERAAPRRGLPPLPMTPTLLPIGAAQFPGDPELNRNPRARSAVLRVAERLP